MHVYAHACICISNYHVFAYVCIRMAVNDCAYSSQMTRYPNEPLPHHLHPHRGGGGANRPGRGGGGPKRGGGATGSPEVVETQAAGA